MTELCNYAPASTKLKGGKLVSRRQTVCPSVCGHNRVRSVFSTILVGSISYLHILSSNFGRCVACKGYCKIPEFECLVIFWNLWLSFCLFLTWILMWIISMGNHWAVGVSQNAGVLVVLVKDSHYYDITKLNYENLFSPRLMCCIIHEYRMSTSDPSSCIDTWSECEIWCVYIV